MTPRAALDAALRELVLQRFRSSRPSSGRQLIRDFVADLIAPLADRRAACTSQSADADLDRVAGELAWGVRRAFWPPLPPRKTSTA